MHLNAAQIVAAEDCCPVCGSRELRRNAGLIQSEPAIDLLLCRHCRGCSASHMPKPEVLDEYYSGYFTGDGPKTTLPEINKFADSLSRMMPLNDSADRVSILDFGGGDGSLGFAIARKLLAARANRKVEFTLVDYQSPAALEGNERLSVTHHRKLEEVEGPFDIVLASAILEHIPELRPTLLRLFNLISPAGWFYARTSYVVPLKRLLPGLDITYPGHVHDLGAPFWNRVPTTFEQPLRIVVSRPSPVETKFLRQPFRTVVASLMKFPAHVETTVFPVPRTPCWRLVGGWEIVMHQERC
jgi:hypothetical protein